VFPCVRMPPWDLLFAKGSSCHEVVNPFYQQKAYLEYRRRKRVTLIFTVPAPAIPVLVNYGGFEDVVCRIVGGLVVFVALNRWWFGSFRLR